MDRLRTSGRPSSVSLHPTPPGLLRTPAFHLQPSLSPLSMDIPDSNIDVLSASTVTGSLPWHCSSNSCIHSMSEARRWAGLGRGSLTSSAGLLSRLALSSLPLLQFSQSLLSALDLSSTIQKRKHVTVGHVARAYYRLCFRTTK